MCLTRGPHVAVRAYRLSSAHVSYSRLLTYLTGVRLLLRYGADIDLTDDHCETPLVKAVTHYHPSVVRTLLKQEHSISDIKRYELSELLWAMIEDLSGLSDEDKTVNEPKVSMI